MNCDATHSRSIEISTIDNSVLVHLPGCLFQHARHVTYPIPTLPFIQDLSFRLREYLLCSIGPSNYHIIPFSSQAISLNTTNSYLLTLWREDIMGMPFSMKMGFLQWHQVMRKWFSTGICYNYIL